MVDHAGVYVQKALALPFLLLLLGMFGGGASFGLVGLFLGPTLLAIAHSLVEEWSNKRSSVADAPTLPRGGATPSADPALSRRSSMNCKKFCALPTRDSRWRTGFLLL